jgi:hypothetical protein
MQLVEDSKEDFHPFDGPSKFIKEIDRNKWNVFNLFNNGILKDKPASSGITMINKK